MSALRSWWDRLRRKNTPEPLPPYEDPEVKAEKQQALLRQHEEKMENPRPGDRYTTGGD